MTSILEVYHVVIYRPLLLSMTLQPYFLKDLFFFFDSLLYVLPEIFNSDSIWKKYKEIMPHISFFSDFFSCNVC